MAQSRSARPGPTTPTLRSRANCRSRSFPQRAVSSRRARRLIEQNCGFSLPSADSAATRTPSAQFAALQARQARHGDDASVSTLASISGAATPLSTVNFSISEPARVGDFAGQRRGGGHHRTGQMVRARGPGDDEIAFEWTRSARPAQRTRHWRRRKARSPARAIRTRVEKNAVQPFGLPSRLIVCEPHYPGAHVRRNAARRGAPDRRRGADRRGGCWCTSDEHAIDARAGDCLSRARPCNRARSASQPALRIGGLRRIGTCAPTAMVSCGWCPVICGSTTAASTSTSRSKHAPSSVSSVLQ